MSTTVAGSDLRVVVARWPGFEMSRSEVVAALTFLAHKAGKAVRCSEYRDVLQYSADTTNVYLPGTETAYKPVPVDHVKLGGVIHPLDPNQTAFPEQDAPGTEIKDEEGRALARVDHNCVVILIDITAVDNEAGKAILAYVVEQAIPLLDFDVTEKLREQRAWVTEAYAEFHMSAIRSRMQDKTADVNRLERDATELYYRLVNVERELPLAKQELELMEEQIDKKDCHVVEKQTEGILALIANGQYEEISPSTDGSLFARTSNILIEHNDWVFELGRYEINIDAAGKVTIYSADGTEADGYPHPHVDSNGKPCWGNIGPDLAKAIGRMRVFEALTLLYDFLASYNPDGPFVRIGKFDDNYDDPDENPCEDCEDYHSPYCVCECPHNDGLYSCADCCEYRTDYCYRECEYNVPGFEYCSPCDECEESKEYCFLNCEYNDAWQINSPCDGCNKPSCDGCPYLEKKLQLEAKQQPVTTS